MHHYDADRFIYDSTARFVHSCVLNASRSSGKERDAESGNDYFGARYFGSTMGRFMSPDPMIIMKQKLIDPQQWNMYSYARNNPLRFTDPTGKYVCADGSKCDSKNDQAFKTRLDNLRTAQAGLKAGSDAYNKIGAILTAYGNAGDTGTANGKTVAISFTGAANGGGVTQSLDKSTIGVNLSSNFSEQSGANNLGTTVLVGHEGQHVVDGAPTGTARFGSEVRAESASQGILEGLYSNPQTDSGLRPYGDFTMPSRGNRVLWSPTWSDPGQLSGAPSAAFLIGVEDYKSDVQSDHK
jgi:RHS repeat-associated protein